MPSGPVVLLAGVEGGESKKNTSFSDITILSSFDCGAESVWIRTGDMLVGFNKGVENKSLVDD